MLIYFPIEYIICSHARFIQTTSDESYKELFERIIKFGFRFLGSKREYGIQQPDNTYVHIPILFYNIILK